MIMQMLVAGGMPVLASTDRQPDAMNPRGYFEYAPVRTIAHDQDFLSLARGKAIKIVVPLIALIEPSLPYKLIMMRRRIADVAASQAAMLRHGGHAVPDGMEPLLAWQLKSTIETLGHIPQIDLDYELVIADPERSAKAIAAFVGRDLDVEAMARTVDRSLAHHYPR
ncbi:hypothetical protein Q9Q95_07060 [Sphingomonas sp. DG1-23]|uniref:hypothetical protein n=1 Tax=Sphingomonas sp. DG1-23 TaxID=3068316 RepID=UPI0027402CFF|nr:hypothetical protein [Sphingomonas sp. DG1-23]MDP5278678.1 hypothetical protein [Sphingomonas sp. DG1-23]